VFPSRLPHAVNHDRRYRYYVERSLLKPEAKENTPTRVIGLKLGRTPASIQNKATREGISLKPTNQSPYGRRS
jgi:hypothetical protein